MGQQPAVDHRRLMRGEVAADHVDGQAGFGLAVDLVQEVAEVHRPVLVEQLADDYRLARDYDRIGDHEAAQREREKHAQLVKAIR